MSPQWESQELLQPITDEQPCGENVEYTLLPTLSDFKVFGKDQPIDPPPEWDAIRALSLEALRKSKDIRLLAYLGTALLRSDGLRAFVGTLDIASQWLQTYWAGVYPLIDDGDAVERKNALNYFADKMAVLDGLRRAPLVVSPQHGRFSLRDLDIAAGLMQPTGDEERPDERRIDAAFDDMPLEQLQGLQESAATAIKALKAIADTMSTEGGADAEPDFDELSALLVRLDKLLRARLAVRVEAAAAAAGGAEGAAAGTGVAMAGVGAIRSRQDAIRALDAVSKFFTANEPSSPVPMLIERAKRLVSKNFLEVLADIAPDAVPQARSAGGLAQETSE
jgi:type VI secretion system protein ImpA